MRAKPRPPSTAVFLTGCLALGAHVSGVAQTPGGAMLREIRVDASAEAETATTPVYGYRAKNAVTATKTDTPLSETPQSVTVVTRDQILDQGAKTVQDALTYAAGVRSDAYGLDSRTDSVRIRGADPAEYLDGLRKTNGYYTANARTDPYTLERIEVLRGPSAMLFGQGSTAGVVNLVSKRPLAETQREIGAELGSFGRKQIQTDLTGSLTADGDWSYRLIALQRKSDTQVDHVPDDRSLLAPSLTWRPSGATSVTLQALYQKDKSGSSAQFFPWTGTVLPSRNGQLSSSTFIGQPGDHYDTERKTLGYLLEHKFNDQWTLRQNLRVARNDVSYLSAYGDSFSLPGGWSADPVNQRLLGRYYYNEQRRVDAINADQHVEGRFATGAVRHQMLAGLDFARFKTRSATGFDASVDLGGSLPLIDAYQPMLTTSVAPALTSAPLNTMRQTGLYLQDQMKLDSWIIVAGLRHDRVNDRTEGAEARDDSATTKRLGVMYALPGGWSPYLSYSESFTPQSPTATGMRLKPLRGEQVEAGLKYEPVGSAMAFNAAVYDLKEKNRTLNPFPNVTTQLGKTRNRGVELEARGAVNSVIDVIANYTYTDLDEQLEGLPRQQASLWGRYRFAVGGEGGFSVGTGLRLLSDFRDTSSGTGPRVPGVALVDLVLAYETTQWRYALNINNVTDKTYFSTCLSRGDCWFGAGRNVVASATYRF